MVAPLIIGAARLAAAALAKQAAKKTGQEIAKKTAVEAAKKEIRPAVAKGEYVEAVKKQGIPTTKGKLAKANKEVTKGNKIDPAVTRKGKQSYSTNRAQQASKKDSSGYDGIRFDDSEYPF